MGKGIYKQNTADLNNQLKQENKRMVLMNKLKNKVEEKNGQRLTKLKFKHVINETTKSGVLLEFR